MQTVTRNPEIYLTINTLPSNEQSCLIVNTISIDEEEHIINKHMKQKNSKVFWKRSL